MGAGLNGRKTNTSLRRSVKYLYLAIGLFLGGGCGWFGGDEIPDALLGNWVTDEDRYAEAVLEIAKETITFSKGLEWINMNRIDQVTVDEKADKTLIKISYQDKEGGEFTLSLYHYPGPGAGSIRFVNQMQMVWTKEAEAE